MYIARGGLKIYGPPKKESSDSEPAVFLAGPIQGAPNWQDEAINIIGGIPRKRPLGVYNPRVAGELEHSYADQIAWEKFHLLRARDYGAIIFWFAAQDLSLPYPQGRSYAQTSRIEFGRVMGWLDCVPRGVNVALGFDSCYEGGNEQYIRSCAEEYEIAVHNNIITLCHEAVKIALEK